MPQTITRAYDGSVSEIDRERREIVAVVNTDAVDRYRTVILPEGGRFENYRRNPVVLYNHDGCALPIGKNLWIKPSKRRLVARTRFLPQGKDETADKVFDLYADGFLNAWSISFDPIADGAPTPDELRKNPEWASCRCVYREWDLLEYSCVTLPGNPEAVRAARARGLALPGWPDEAPAAPPPAAPELPPLVGRTMAQVAEAMKRQIRAEFFAGDTKDRLRRDIAELARGMV
jgi:phage head maturation protease